MTEKDEALVNAGAEQLSGEAVLVHGRDGIIVEWNADAQALFGWPAKHAIGMAAHRLIPARNRERHDASIRAILADANRPTHQRNITVVHQNGDEFTVELSIQAIVRSDGDYVIGRARKLSAPRRGQEVFRGD